MLNKMQNLAVKTLCGCLTKFLQNLKVSNQSNQSYCVSSRKKPKKTVGNQSYQKPAIGRRFFFTKRLLCVSKENQGFMNIFMRKSSMAENELKDLIETLRAKFEGQNAEKANGKTQRSVAKAGSRSRSEAYRAGIEYKCSHD
jgi:hypothetical protein